MTEKMLPTRSRTPQGVRGLPRPPRLHLLVVIRDGRLVGATQQAGRGGTPPAKGGVQPGQVSTLTGGRSLTATADTGHRGDGTGNRRDP